MGNGTGRDGVLRIRNKGWCCLKATYVRLPVAKEQRKGHVITHLYFFVGCLGVAFVCKGFWLLVKFFITFW
jgi:hypothetical protein